MVVVKRSAGFVLLLVNWVLACDVRGPAVGSGGVDFDGGGLSDGRDVEDGARGLQCPRGLVIINTDFEKATTVSILDPKGKVLSETFYSSASGSLGLSEPLGGDVMIPTMPIGGNNVVLLDNSTSVVTWVDLESSAVVGQLRVGTESFHAIPHDYVQVAPDRAYVTRFGVNNSPGGQPFDSGNDIAIVDLRGRRLIATLALDGALEGVDPRYLARPDKMVRVGDYVYVLLNMLTKTWPYQGTDGRVAVIDTTLEKVVGVLELAGLLECVGLALSPNQMQLAVSCSGGFDGDSYATLDGSGAVLVDIDGSEMSERRRWPATHFGAGPLGFHLSFASEDLLAVTTFPLEGGGVAVNRDALLTLDLVTDQVELVFEAAREFTLGHVRCLPGCGACLLADADRRGGMLHRYRVEEGSLRPDGRGAVDSSTGLLPWAIGVLE